MIYLFRYGFEIHGVVAKNKKRAKWYMKPKRAKYWKAVTPTQALHIKIDVGHNADHAVITTRKFLIDCGASELALSAIPE